MVRCPACICFLNLPIASPSGPLHGMLCKRALSIVLLSCTSFPNAQVAVRPAAVSATEATPEQSSPVVRLVRRHPSLYCACNWTRARRNQQPQPSLRAARSTAHVHGDEQPQPPSGAQMAGQGQRRGAGGHAD